MSTVRPIKCYVVASGVPCPVIQCEVSQSSHASADTFNASLPMRNPLGAAFWADTPQIDVVVIAMTGDDANELFVGTVDKVSISFETTEIRISGRDETKKPIDKKKNGDSFRNKTPSQVVQEYAGRSGLGADLQAVSDMAGKIWHQHHDYIANNQSDWTAMQILADREGLTCYAEGGKVVMKELDDATYGTFDLVYVPPTPANYANGNFIALHCERNLQLAKKTTVKVQSWHTKKKKKMEGTATLDGGGDGENEYNYRHEGLTDEQAQKIAEKRLREHTRHERTITVDLPGQPSVRPRMKVSLSGTGTAFDQDYFIDKVTHRISSGEGYRMTLTSKNTSKNRSATRLAQPKKEG